MAASGRRAAVLATLREADAPLRVGEIAARLGVHPNTARFHLAALVRSGQVLQVPTTPQRRGRPAVRYAPAPGMDPAGARRYRLLAEMLTETLAADPRAPDRAAAVGRATGARIAASEPAPGPAATRLAELLTSLGFEPETGSAPDEFALRNCPFLELARTRPEVVCRLHLGLLQGALATWDSSAEVRLVPFARPDCCVAQLIPKGGPA